MHSNTTIFSRYVRILSTAIAIPPNPTGYTIRSYVHVLEYVHKWLECVFDMT